MSWVADGRRSVALERLHVAHGFYHLLGADLSPLDGVVPQI